MAVLVVTLYGTGRNSRARLVDTERLSYPGQETFGFDTRDGYVGVSVSPAAPGEVFDVDEDGYVRASSRPVLDAG